MWVPGNHEFNYGMDVLRDVIAQHECNVLCSNVYNYTGVGVKLPEREVVRIQKWYVENCCGRYAFLLSGAYNKALMGHLRDHRKEAKR